jgi:hypothetical protein
VDPQQVEELTTNPTESLAFEIKTWIDPDSPEGRAKIVKSCIALRNNDGGALLIGFNNQTGAPDPNTLLQDVKASFHIDKIQGMVTKHASESFEVEIHWIERDSQSYPLIAVPGGVKSPVAARSPITDGANVLLAEHRVYIRSLQSNNTPATTEATWKDWPTVVSRCFENHEADIGRFVRRHLTPDVIQQLRDALGSLPQPAPPASTLAEQARIFLNESAVRFDAVAAALPEQLPPHDAWEVAAVVGDPLQRHTNNTKFLNLINSSNPRYTGWPLWINSRTRNDETSHPRVVDGAWEAMVIGRNVGHIDFWRASGAGKFYQRRAYEDDTKAAFSSAAPKPQTVLDFGLVIYRTAEAIAVPLEFIRAMGGTSDDTQVAFCFRWRGLKGRRLSTWANPNRMLWDDDLTAYQDEVTASIVVPLSAAKTSIPAYTNEVVRPVFEVFGGAEISPSVVDEMVTSMLTRRW